MVSKLGLFSRNETKEDVSTANLKYLLVCPSPPPQLLPVQVRGTGCDGTRCLVSFIQLSVQLEITPGQFYSVVGTIAKKKKESLVPNGKDNQAILFQYCPFS